MSYDYKVIALEQLLLRKILLLKEQDYFVGHLDRIEIDIQDTDYKINKIIQDNKLSTEYLDKMYIEAKNLYRKIIKGREKENEYRNE